MIKLHGVVIALLTLFKRRGQEIDFVATGELIDALLKLDINGLFVAGSTGEGPLMSVDERRLLAHFAVDRVGGKIPVLVHTGCLNTRDTIELTRHARLIGADAAVFVPPFYYNFDDRAVSEYCSTIARSVPDYPLFLYNIPVFVKNDFPPKLVETIAKRHPNIIGIKDSTGSPERLKEYLRIRANNFIVMCGADELSLDGLMWGTKGSVSATANVIPTFFTKLYANFQRGNIRAARKWQEKILEVGRLVWTPNIVPLMKEMLRLLAMPTGASRSPQRQLTRAERTRLARGLRELGII
jgi:4-hydroxy-tetrahydrodipicolinate synthase